MPELRCSSRRAGSVLPSKVLFQRGLASGRNQRRPQGRRPQGRRRRRRRRRWHRLRHAGPHGRPPKDTARRLRCLAARRTTKRRSRCRRRSMPMDRPAPRGRISTTSADPALPGCRRTSTTCRPTTFAVLTGCHAASHSPRSHLRTRWLLPTRTRRARLTWRHHPPLLACRRPMVTVGCHLPGLQSPRLASWTFRRCRGTARSPRCPAGRSSTRRRSRRSSSRPSMPRWSLRQCQPTSRA